MRALKLIRPRWRSIGVHACLGVLTGGGLCGPVLLYAQQVSVPAPVVGAEFPHPPAFDKTRIRSAQACVSTLEYVRNRVQQEWLGDTLQLDESRPTPRAVSEMAQWCWNTFPIDRVDTIELPTMLSIAAGIGDIRLFQTVFTRLLAMQSTVHGKVELLTSVYIAARRMQPMPLPFLHTLLAHLDSLGPVAAVSQYSVRRGLYTSYERLGTAPDSMVTQAEGMLTFLDRLTTTADNGGIANIADTVAIYRREAAWYRYLRDGTPEAFKAWNAALPPGQRRMLIGEQAPLITGEFWLHRTAGDGRGAPTPNRGPGPLVGRVTLVFGGADGTVDGAMRKQWNLVARIHARFPNVNLIMLAQTRGAVMRAMRVDDPAREAAMLGQVYLDSLKLPVWLNVSTGVIDTSLRTLDGTPVVYNSQTYDAWRVSGAFSGGLVIDHKGYVVRRLEWYRMSPEQIFTILERLLRIQETSVVSTQ